MTEPLAAELRRLVLLGAGAAAVGVLLGQPAWTLAAAAAAYAGWHLWNAARLLRWLEQRRRTELPDSPGIWRGLNRGLAALELRNRQRKEALTAIIDRFRDATEAMPDAAVVLGGEETIVWFNEAATRLLGLRTRDDVGTQLTNLVRDPDFAEYLRRQDVHESIEIPSPEDEAVMLSVRVVPYGQDQRLLLARDVTRLHRLEAVQRDFVANVSHELRSPLTVIRGYVENLLEAEEEDGDVYRGRALQQMDDQVTHMCRLVDDLLRLARLESDRAPGRNDIVDVAAELEAIRQSVVELEECQHEVALTADTGVRLIGDRGELRSAFSNLIYNAVRYTPSPGRIRITWRAERGGARLDVTDNGPGIDPRHIARLTERFYRVDKARSREQGGTGLGLAIVKHVLLRHDARLEISSEPGAGSTFTCVFPAHRVSLGRAGGDARSSPRSA